MADGIVLHSRKDTSLFSPKGTLMVHLLPYFVRLESRAHAKDSRYKCMLFIAIMCPRVTFAEVVKLLEYYRSFAKAVRSKTKNSLCVCPE